MFVVIEGIDGSGKSTLAKALADRLGPSRVVLTREPTDLSPWGKRLREAAIKGRLEREDEIEHFHRDRVHHLQTLIRPALAQGKVVITDRYVDSTLAYQAKDIADADELFAKMAPELDTPDLVIVLDLPVEMALKRIGKGRGEKTQFELKETLERARALYDSRKGPQYHHLDASKPFNEVVTAALALIKASPKFPSA
ncbi:MAG: dTMP kinase [Alphaproteobacteria bacterium]